MVNFGRINRFFVTMCSCLVKSNRSVALKRLSLAKLPHVPALKAECQCFLKIDLVLAWFCVFGPTDKNNVSRVSVTTPDVLPTELRLTNEDIYFHEFLRAQAPGSTGIYFRLLWRNNTNWWARFGRLPEGIGWAGDGLKLLKGSLRDAWRPGGVRPCAASRILVRETRTH